MNAKIYAMDFVFTGRDEIEYVVGFRINNHTIKRGTPKSNRLSK